MNKFARFRYQPCIPLGKDGKCVTASKEHIALSREAACEGMVLLKNEHGSLPLKKGAKIALFGKAVIDYIKGGGGSGDVNAPYVCNIYEGFKEKEAEGKVKIYMPLVDFYKSYAEEAGKKVLTRKQIDKIWDKVNAMPFGQERDDITYDTFYKMHMPEAEVPDEVIAGAADYADTAVMTFSRFSGEGTDRRAIGDDYYLSATEKELLKKNYQKR